MDADEVERQRTCCANLSYARQIREIVRERACNYPLKRARFCRRNGGHAAARSSGSTDSRMPTVFSTASSVFNVGLPQRRDRLYRSYSASCRPSRGLRPRSLNQRASGTSQSLSTPSFRNPLPRSRSGGSILRLADRHNWSRLLPSLGVALPFGRPRLQRSCSACRTLGAPTSTGLPSSAQRMIDPDLRWTLPSMTALRRCASRMSGHSSVLLM